MSDVESELEALYGARTLCTEGVVHVVHVARGGDGLLYPLRIGEGSPRSASDFFVLNLCRARADVILTSAENLRREPHLHHALQGPWAPQLAEYRRVKLGKTSPPACAILTRSGALPGNNHPVWSDGTDKLVLTTPAGAEALQADLAARALIIATDEMEPRLACTYLQQRGAKLISVEAGPTVARNLYQQPAIAQELLLTEWLSPTANAPLVAALPEERLLLAGLEKRGSSERIEAGQRFRFTRWVRA